MRISQGNLPATTTHKGKTSTMLGHSVQKIDNREIFRALFQNPNGIDPSAGNYEFMLSLTECYDHCVSLVGLVESNREWKHAYQQQQLRDSIHKVLKS